MTLAIWIIILFVLGVIGLFVFLWFDIEKKRKGFFKFNEEIQQNTIKEPNYSLNNLLLEYSENPTEELNAKILNILKQNNTYIILTYYDNNDPNDKRVETPTNSINFRKIKNGNIGTFTDFDIMKKYVGNIGNKYLSSDIMLIGNFLNLCVNFGGITSITLNFTLPNPYTLTLKKNNDKI